VHERLTDRLAFGDVVAFQPEGRLGGQDIVWIGGDPTLE
jgi:hypothetical protein